MLDCDFKKLIEAIKNRRCGGTICLSAYYVYDKQASEINETHAELDDKQAAELADILKNDTTIYFLRLNNVRMSKNGFHAIAEMLKVNTTLRTLELGMHKGSPLSSEKPARNPGDILPIIKALETNESLMQLDLAGCNLRDEDAQAFKTVFEVNNTLESVSLKNNYITSSGGSAIATGLLKNTQVFQLHLMGNDLGDAYSHFVKLVQQNTTLLNLYLDAPREIQDQIRDLTNANQARQLRRKELGLLRKENSPPKPETSSASPAKVSMPATSPAKVSMPCSPGVPVATPEPKPLVFNTLGFSPGDTKSKVEKFFLPDSHGIREIIFKDLLTSIKNATHGKSLDLNQQLLKADEVTQLAETLKKDTVIETLNLSNTRIRDPEYRAIAEMLKVNTTLKILNLSLNPLGSCLPLIKALETHKSLIEIDLSGCRVYAEEAAALAKVLRTNKTLKRLNLANNSISAYGSPKYRDEDIVSALEENTTVTHINLKGNRGVWPSICYFTDTLASKNTTLEVMECDFPPLASFNQKEAFEKIQAFTSRNRNLKQNPQTQQQREAQKKGLEVKLETEKALTGKQENDPAPGTEIQRDPSVMPDRKFKKLLHDIQTFPFEKTLSLDSELIDDKQAIELAEILKKDRTIDTLNLPTNKIGKQGFLAIAELLTVNTTLERVCLHFNESYPTTRDVGNMLPFIKGLESNPSLQAVYLKNCNLNDDDAQAFKKVFEVNKKLRTVDLSDNHIRPLGGRAIAKGLENNSALTSLSLEGNDFLDAYPAFEELVKKNTTLEKLQLETYRYGVRKREILKRIEACVDSNLSERSRSNIVEREKLRMQNFRLENLKSNKPFVFNTFGYSDEDRKSVTESVLAIKRESEQVLDIYTQMKTSQFLEFSSGKNCEEMLSQPLYPHGEYADFQRLYPDAVFKPIYGTLYGSSRLSREPEYLPPRESHSDAMKRAARAAEREHEERFGSGAPRYSAPLYQDGHPTGQVAFWDNLPPMRPMKDDSKRGESGTYVHAFYDHVTREHITLPRESKRP